MSRYELPTTPFIERVIKPAERLAMAQYTKTLARIEASRVAATRSIIEGKEIRSAERYDAKGGKPDGE